jgi:hypothetical protein
VEFFCARVGCVEAKFGFECGAPRFVTIMCGK